MCVVLAGITVGREEVPRNRVEAAECAKVVSTLKLDALGA
jgi:hypothetical protein